MKSARWPTIGLVVLALVAVATVSAAFVKQSSPVTAPASALSPAYAETPSAPVAVFIGDSYTAGVGDGGPGWTTGVAKAQGWVEVNLAHSGTGYTASLGPDSPAYPDMVAAAVAQAPDIVVVSGGRSDKTPSQSAITETYEQLREQLPNVRIIAVAPMWDDSPYPNRLTTMGTMIEEAVTAVDGEYLDIDRPLRSHPELIMPDGVHPTTEGHAELARAVNEALAAASTN